ncbi:MAG: hypothetical protein HRU27_19575 [Rhizobiaceae bacterium]|nr:hypothetical protein [Rhizobiaceae bacterium]
MVWVARIFLGLQMMTLMAALGAVILFFGAITIGQLFGASNMEGGLAMGAAGLMPIGGMIGAAFGIWVTWWLAKRLSPGATMVVGFGLAVLVAAAVAGWFIYDELSDGNPYQMGQEPDVFIEWRLPETVTADQVDRRYRFMARSSYENWILSDSWDQPRVRDENGVSILRLKVQIRWRVTGRILQFWPASTPNDRITVDLGLPRDPQNQTEYGPWREVSGHPGHAFRTRVVKR